MNWRLQALCREVGHPDDWFQANDHRSTVFAVQVCRQCPVAAECFTEVQSLPPEQARHGVWGGTTPAQRADMTPRARSYGTRSCRICGTDFVRSQPNQLVCLQLECRRVARREMSRRYEKSGRRQR